MHASTEAATVAYVTTAEPPPAIDFAATTVTLSGDADQIHTELSVELSCVLLAADIPAEQRLATLRAIRRDRRTLPVIVFTDGPDEHFVDRLFQAGATDVLLSPAEQTPSSLLRRRIDAVSKAGAVERQRQSVLERYETLLDTAGDAIYQVDLDGRMVEANRASAELLCYDREQLVGTHISELLSEESLERGQELGRRQLAGDADDVTTITLDFEPRDGDELIPCRARISTVREGGSVVGWVGVARDVRAQREREAELERTRELLTNAEHLGDVGVWELDPEADTLFWSDGARRIRGASEELELTTEHVLEFYHPDDRDRISALVQECQETGDSFSTEARIITAEGEERWVHLQGEGIDVGRESYNVRGYIQDITERVEREQALQAERDLIEQILEISPIGIMSVDTDGRIVRANEQASKIFGAPETSLEGAHFTGEDVRVFTPNGTELDPEEYPVTRILEDGDTVHDKRLVIERPDGERRTIELDAVPLREDGKVRQAIFTFDDVTEDVERETRLTEQRNELAQLDHINRIIRGVDQALLGAETREEIAQAACDHLCSSNRYRFAIAVDFVDERLEPQAWAGPADEYIEAVTPTTEETVESCVATEAIRERSVTVCQSIPDAVTEPGQWQQAALGAGVRSAVAIPIVYEDQSYGAILVYAPFEDFVTERELDVLSELGETVGYAIAAVRRREREQILTSLYETTQDLLAAETEGQVADAVVDAASDVLEPPGIGIFLFDDDHNVLEPTATTDALMSYYGEVTEFGPGQSDAATWQAYAAGETQFYHDVREADHLAHPETDARSTLLIPLGDHGVFVVASPDRTGFSEAKRRLIGLLATTTEAALDRVAGRADIRERDRELAARAERVDQLEHALGLLRGTVDLLGETSTRAELERRACERIADAEGTVFAWIGRIPPDESRIEPTTWAGDADDYLDTVSLAFGGDEPAVRAAESGEFVSVSDVTDRLQSQDWARAGTNRGVQSIAAVPLVHGETTYGVLAVYASEPEAFVEPVRSVLDQLACTVAYGINAVEMNQGVLAEQLTELEVAIETPGTVLNAVSAAAGQPVTYREITPEPGGSARVLFALADPPVEEILALESEFVTVDSLTHTERGGEHLFRATLSGPTVAATLLDCGAIPRSVVAEADETRAVLRLSREIDVRVFLERVRQQYPETELLSRTDVERSQAEAAAMPTATEEELTDRQREVLVTAYESGFFESPRETTGEQLAELLNLSQPTVTHHLREAQRRLFAAILDGE